MGAARRRAYPTAAGMENRRGIVMMWLRLATLVLLVGCSSAVGSAVPLLTYDDQTHCHPAPALGRLVVDPTYGTAIAFDGQPPLSRPIAWPPGFSGRHVGGEIEVVAPDGRVAAATGKRYAFVGVGGEVGGVVAFVSCAETFEPE